MAWSEPRRGVALIMVLLVLSALAIVATPFAVSMALHDRASKGFEGEVKARLAAQGARTHAVARLRRTLTAEESDAEARELEEKRPPDPTRKRSYGSSFRSGMQGIRSAANRGRNRGRRPSLVRRADLGERAQKRRSFDRWAREARERGATSIDMETNPIYLVSEKGPSPKTWDAASDLEVILPAPVDIEDEEAGPLGLEGGGLSTRVTVEDEQGKVNLNTAPPVLLGNLMGMSRLARPLEPGADRLSLEDPVPFRTDGDPRTLDGAVVVVHRDNFRVEALTYRSRKGNDLEDCFRGAFLSVPYGDPFPAGSYVYDLRGYKLGHHQLRAHSEGSFAPRKLGELATVEAMREISSWQVAGLFLVRFRGEGLTKEFLERNGVNARKLEELGLDPAIFEGDGQELDRRQEAEYKAAEKSLRKLRISTGFISNLRKARGPRGVMSFEARVANLKPAEAQKASSDLQKALDRERRQAPRFDRKYLEEALANLAEVYSTPGVETFLPEEVEHLRPFVTVSSNLPALWSEAQTNPDPLPAGPTWGESFRAARPGELGGGALVRIRSQEDPEQVEFNRVVHRGGNVPMGGFQLLYPLERHYPAYEASIQALQRHPVNVNTASERVLKAVFTGVTGFRRDKEGDHTVSPEEAGRLALLVRSRLPLKGHEDFQGILEDAARNDTIDDEDIEPLLLNAIQPNDPRLKVSTTGLSYATGDVYTVESVATLRSEALTRLGSAHLREIVEVSAPHPLRLGLFAQGDYQSELFLRDPYTPSYPQDHAYHAVGFPGIRSHLVLSSPLLLWRARAADADLKKGFLDFPIAGGEVGTLRLASPESQEKTGVTLGDIKSFRNFPEGLELAPHEPFVLDISFDQSQGALGQGLTGGGARQGAAGTSGASGAAGAGGTARGGGGGAGGGRGASGTGGAGAGLGGTLAMGGGAGGTGILDLTNMPAAVDFWVRFRTYPDAVNHEGHAVILDAGAAEDRNRLSLLYDRSRLEFVARIYDSSLPDPSIPEGKQYVEIRAKRPLDLHTWYHLRLAWSGTYQGGLQLFIDGLPAGKASFSTELQSNIPIQAARVVPMKDVSVFPLTAGFPQALRVGQEIIEVGQGGAIRKIERSFYQTWREAKEAKLKPQDAQDAALDGGRLPPTGSGNTPGSPLAGSVVQERLYMRGPWNMRASAGGPHPAGTPVNLHGYSLPIQRKISDQWDHEHQVGIEGACVHGLNHSGCDRRVWTPGGLTLADDLLPWRNFPPEIVGIHHYCPRPLGELLGGGGDGRPGGSAGGAPTQQGQFGNMLAPLFLIDLRKVGSNVLPPEAAEMVAKLRGQGKYFAYTPEIQWAGKVYNAVDFFQREGVVLAWLHERDDTARRVIHTTQVNLHYDSKVGLPAGHPAASVGDLGTAALFSRFFPVQILPQRWGLRIARWYPLETLQRSPPGARGGEARGLGPRPEIIPTYYFGACLRPISVLAAGSVSTRYPASGILEIRGSPAPWVSAEGLPPRPDLSSAPLFQNHPEDTVEWIRYVKVYLDRMFIGRWREKNHEVGAELFTRDPFDRDGYNNFRAYPETRDALKNQMFHRQGESIRLVMELADGGAGFGDFVTIATDDPAVGEPVVRRIYSVSERSDGRFFVSLVDVDPSGRELLTSMPYLHTYTPPMNPRLVKFPSGALPQVGTGRMVFFGESGGGSAAAAAPPRSASRSIEEEESAGLVLDEIRRMYDRSTPVQPGRGQRIKHVVVPLDNGRVQFQQVGAGQAAIGGLIPPGRAVTPASPLEVLVVSVGRDPEPFARGVERGVLRIGEELFFFENPDEEGRSPGAAVAGGAAAGAGAASGQGKVIAPWPTQVEEDDSRGQPGLPGQPPATPPRTPPGTPPTQQGGIYDPDQTGEERYDARARVSSSPPVVEAQGKFEQEGFARLDDRSEELHGFYEIFYYRQHTGGRFQNCLRGQFQTPLVARTKADIKNPHRLTNVTQRLRLTGRSLLASEPASHGFGDPVSLVPYLDLVEITGPMTDTGITVRDTRGFPRHGYLLLDSTVPGAPFEIVAYRGLSGEAMFQRPLDEQGKGILRGCFGTVERPIHSGMFAYALPYRHYDRYQSETDSEELAYLQKSFRVPAAFWRSLSFRERLPRGGQERLCDVVIAARVDGAPDWSAKPTNERGGLFFFEERDGRTTGAGEFPLEVPGDELEVRVYFRYKNGSFQRVQDDIWRDDWKETPVLEWIAVEYEKAGRVLRHEEPAD